MIRKMSVKVRCLLLSLVMLLLFAGCSTPASQTPVSQTAAEALSSETAADENETPDTKETEDASSLSEEEQTAAETPADTTEEAQTVKETAAETTTAVESEPVPDEDGTYTSKEEVAAYINCYGHLPSNYVTKKEAEALGWGNGKQLGKVAPGKSIGGSRFGNYEGLLPAKSGRTYYECDIDYTGGSRNAKRIVYSNDGLIYYTDDHYESFELLYGTP